MKIRAKIERMAQVVAWSRGRIAALLFCLVSMLVFASETSVGQEAKPGDRGIGPTPLARHVPLRDLLLYLEFDGLDAHPDAWHASAAYKLLHDTKLGALLEELALQGVELAQESIPREQRVTGAQVVGLIIQACKSGFVLGVSRKGQGENQVVLAVRHGDRPELKRLLEIADAAGRRDGEEGKANLFRVEAGRTLYRLGTGGVWLVENGDLILTGPTNVDEILAVLDGHQKSAVDHPLRTELARVDDGFQPAAIGWIDMASLAPEEFGLDLGLKRIELRWGFQDDALLTTLRVVAPVPRRGLAALLDQPTFGLNSLPPLPPNLTHLTVASIDLAKSYDQIDRLMKSPDAPSPTDPPNVGILARHGIDLRKDLVPHLGPRMAFYAQAPRNEDTGAPVSILMSHFAGFTLTAQVRDEAAVSAGIESLIKSFNPILREQLRGVPRQRFGASLAFLKFAKAPGPRPFYVLDLPPDTIPQPYAKALRLTVEPSHDQLVVGASLLAAEQALVDGPRWHPAGAFVPVVNRLPAEMVYMSLSDPRAGTSVFVRILPILVRQINAEIALSKRWVGKGPGDVALRLDPDLIPPAEALNRLLFPSSTAIVVDQDGAIMTHREAIPSLTSPVTAAALVALFLPAFQASREAARRARCVNNLKQIALAMHNFHSANNTFPMPATMGAKGNPLLSWRVAILPYLGQQELYNKFKHNQPWDSPHNKALLKEMPSMYLCPNRTRVEPFTTSYRVFAGNGALFDKDQEIGVANITDGTANTIMVVEAKEAVPWTKPDDLPFDPDAAPSLYGAGSPHAGGFNAAMGNGAVRFLTNTIDPNVFRALITRAGGEVIRAGAF